jgi:hypothetical protein
VMACAGGETRCGSSCVKPESNLRNCGMCGNACTGAQACVQGTCTCVAPNQVCDGACTSLNNNRDHCGACDNKCTGQFVCNGKTCGCPGGRKECPNKPRTCVGNLNDCCAGSQIWCGGSLNRCIDADNDKNHCGGCNTVCKRDEVCRGGGCGCPDGTRSCGGGLCIPSDQCCPGSEIACPGQTPGCRPSNDCCQGFRRCGNECRPEGMCCDGQHACGSGPTMICQNAGECCPGTTRCPDKDLCVADLKDCCAAGETPCGEGRCKPAGGCCADSECTGDGPRRCNLGSHRCECAVKACPNDANKCATDGMNGGCCAPSTTLCGAKCIAMNQCCRPADCRPGGMGNRTCNPSNECVCPDGQHTCMADPLACVECCGDDECKGPTPTCGPAHRCICQGTVCGDACCPGRVLCSPLGGCPITLGPPPGPFGGAPPAAVR